MSATAFEANTIVLSAQSIGGGQEFYQVTTGGGFFVKPIREDAVGSLAALYYDSDSGEITYDDGARRKLEETLAARVEEQEVQIKTMTEEMQALHAQVRALTEAVQALRA